MSGTLLPLIDIGISKHIGKYSDALEVPRPARWLFTSGTPGLLPDGTLPATFELQAEQAWKNILLALQRAGMGPEHLVKIVQYLVREEDIAAYGRSALVSSGIAGLLPCCWLLRRSRSLAS